jgi:hypothetical protein
LREGKGSGQLKVESLRSRGAPPAPLTGFSVSVILKSSKSCVLEVRIIKGLRVRFAEVRILKGLEAEGQETGQRMGKYEARVRR